MLYLSNKFEVMIGYANDDHDNCVDVDNDNEDDDNDYCDTKANCAQSNSR